jgi:hypothetical protein
MQTHESRLKLTWYQSRMTKKYRVEKRREANKNLQCLFFCELCDTSEREKERFRELRDSTPSLHRVSSWCFLGLIPPPPAGEKVYNRRYTDRFGGRIQAQGGLYL